MRQNYTNDRDANGVPPMPQRFHKGDHVAWETPQGTTHGEVERRLTTPMKIKDHEVKASPDNPEYLVRSDTSGEYAAHKPDALKKAK